MKGRIVWVGGRGGGGGEWEDCVGGRERGEEGWEGVQESLVLSGNGLVGAVHEGWVSSKFLCPWYRNEWVRLLYQEGYLNVVSVHLCKFTHSSLFSCAMDFLVSLD